MCDFYRPQDIEWLKDAARFYKLDAPQQWWFGKADELVRVCNGAGPERWSLGKRKALTQALLDYEPAFAIHDVDYEYKVIDKNAADRRLKRNMIKIWRRSFGWRRWLTRAGRAERLIVIPTVYAAVALGGDSAWEAAKK